MLTLQQTAIMARCTAAECIETRTIACSASVRSYRELWSIEDVASAEHTLADIQTAASRRLSCICPAFLEYHPNIQAVPQTPMRLPTHHRLGTHYRRARSSSRCRDIGVTRHGPFGAGLTVVCTIVLMMGGQMDTESCKKSDSKRG